MEKNKYLAWKTDSIGNPIEGTDRIFKAESKRNVVKLLAYEEGIEQPHNHFIVRCKDNTNWCVRKY